MPKELILYRAVLNEEEFRITVDNLKNDNSLRILTLKNLDLSGVEIIADFLSSPGILLESLTFEQSVLGKGLSIIAEAVALNKSLKSLDLRQNSIGSSSAEPSEYFYNLLL